MKKLITLFLFLLLTIFIVNQAIAQNIRPSYKQGFARNASESKAPQLWKGLVGCWKPSLGVTGVRTLRDMSGYGNHGTMNTMALDDWVIEEGAYVLDFDGGSDHVIVPHADRLNPGDGSFSFSWRFRSAANPVGAHQRWIAKLTGSQWQAMLRTDGTFFVHIDDDTNGVNGFGGPDIADNLWHSAVVVLDRATDLMTRYIDGEIYDSADDISSVGSIVPSDDLEIGRESPGGNYFEGPMANFNIWNRALTINEVLDLHRFPDASLELRRPVIAKAPVVVPPTGIPIFRRRIEGKCAECHDDNMIVFKFDKQCKRQPELAFNN